jgi:integrase
MPSAIQRGEVWYVRFHDETGQRVSKRTNAKGRREAEALANELETDAERRRMGLAPKRMGAAITLGELCEWWLENRCPPASRKGARWRFTSRVLSFPIAALPLQHVTAARLEGHFFALEKLHPGQSVTINHVRANLRAAFNCARKAELWSGPNVAADTDPRKVPRRAYDTLSAEEVPRMLAFVPAHWRGFFAAAVFQGLRKGECAGLRKPDADLARDLLTIRASYDGETTKGGHADVVPIAPPFRPFIEAAMRSPGLYLFGDRAGKMRGPECDPQEVLRTVLGAAGLVTGYDHTCRRKSCRTGSKPHVEQHADKAPRKCPRCKMKLWPVPLARPIRFQDLRHSCATILLRSGVDAHRVQRILRHASITTTTGIYGHLLTEDLRGAFGAFTPTAPPVAPREPAEKMAASAEMGSNRGPSDSEQEKRGPDPLENLQRDPALFVERATGIEPATLSLGSSCSTS